MSRRTWSWSARAFKLSRSDPESFFLVCDPNIEWDVSRLMPDGRVYHGHEGVSEFWRGWTGTWQGFDFTLDEAVDAGGGRCRCRSARSAGRGSGVPVELFFGQVWTIRNGMVVRFQAFSDYRSALEAVGLSE